MPTATVENYVKRLFVEEQNLDAGTRVTTGRLADVMNVVPGTATTMVKALAEAGLVDYESRGGVRLTDRGRALALHVLRRHRIIELFLVDVLNLDWSEVHAEAEELEHAVSDKVLSRLDELLGHPATDPHGDPIPPADARREPALKTIPLHHVSSGSAIIARIVDQSPAFLDFARSAGLLPGARLAVVAVDPAADQVRLTVGDRPVSLGTAAAAKIRVEA